LSRLNHEKFLAGCLSWTASRVEKTIFTASIWQASQVVAASLATFVPNKHLELVDPGLRVQVSQEDGKQFSP